MKKVGTIKEIWAAFDKDFEKPWSKIISLLSLIFLWKPIYEGLKILGVTKTEGLLSCTVLLNIIAILLFLLYFVYLSLNRRIKEGSKLDTANFQTLNYLCELDSFYVGAKFIDYKIITDIKEDFSAEEFYRMTIKARGGDLHCIEHFSGIPSKPDDIYGKVLGELITDKFKDIQIKAEIIYPSRHDARWIIRFQPPLEENEEIYIEYKESMPPGTFLGKFSMLAARSLEYDYSSDNILYPTEHLSTKVVFPINFFPKNVDFDVWLGLARSRHQKEKNRLFNERCFKKLREERGRYWIGLDINNPIHSLRYVLCWHPPG